MTDYKSLIQTITKGYKDLSASSSDIALFTRWYQGKDPSFHNYTIYNGKKKVKCVKKSMQMAKKVCEDWASLLMNEKVQIAVKSDDGTKKLDDLLMQLDFWNRSNKAVEYAFALSMSALVVGVDNLQIEMSEPNENGVSLGTITSYENAKPKMSIYSAKKIVPIRYENGELVEVAFVDDINSAKHYEIHCIDKDDKFYHIINVDIDENGKETIFDFNTLSDKKWFAIEYPNLVNNFDVDSNNKISIFANAIDTLRALDNAYDSYDVEFVNGRKRIFVSTKLFQVNKDTGEMQATFDPSDTIFYQLPENALNNGQIAELVKSISDQLRTADHSTKIQDELNYLSHKCGLGVDYYRFEKGRVMTATQVISEKSDTFRNVKRHEIVLEKALVDFILALEYVCNKFTTKYAGFDEKELPTIVFDDSIIEDKTTEKKNDTDDLNNKVLTLVDYRKKWYGETDEEAKKYIYEHFGNQDIINKYTAFEPMLTAGVLTPKAFVNLVFTDEDIKSFGYKTKDEYIAEMEEKMKSANTISAEDLLATGGYIKPKENE